MWLGDIAARLSPSLRTTIWAYQDGKAGGNQQIPARYLDAQWATTDVCRKAGLEMTLPSVLK
jgi:hypothetical protein